MAYFSFLKDVQERVAGLLSADPELSSVPFLAEDSRTVDYEIRKNLGRQGVVGLVMTPNAEYIGDFQGERTAWQLPDLTIQVVENPTVNRGREGSVTGQDAAMRAMEVLTDPGGTAHGGFSPVSYEQGEDGGLLVNSVKLRCALYRGKPVPEPPTSGGVWASAQGTRLAWSDGVWLGDDFSSFSVMELSYSGGWTLEVTNSRGLAQEYSSDAPSSAKSLTIGPYELTWSEG